MHGGMQPRAVTMSEYVVESFPDHYHICGEPLLMIGQVYIIALAGVASSTCSFMHAASCVATQAHPLKQNTSKCHDQRYFPVGVSDRTPTSQPCHCT